MKTLLWENSATGKEKESEKKREKVEKGRKDTRKKWKMSNYKGVKWKSESREKKVR